MLITEWKNNKKEKIEEKKLYQHNAQLNVKHANVAKFAV